MAKLEEIIATYGPGLARLASSYEADRALREDLLQEILLAIHRALPSMRDVNKQAAFVFRIAHNRAVTHVARRAQERRASRTAPDISVTESSTQEDACTPEEKLLQDERSRRLMSAVRRLPLPYRQVITLVLEDLSYTDIAQSLGISLSNVGVRVNRAKTLLKDILDA